MNMPLESSRPKELALGRYWSKGCGYSISKECNKLLQWGERRNMARLGPTQTVIREKYEIRMQNSIFQGNKNGKH
jgi:hypothetical protein